MQARLSKYALEWLSTRTTWILVQGKLSSISSSTSSLVSKHRQHAMTSPQGEDSSNRNLLEKTKQNSYEGKLQHQTIYGMVLKSAIHSSRSSRSCCFHFHPCAQKRFLPPLTLSFKIFCSRKIKFYDPILRKRSLKALLVLKYYLIHATVNFHDPTNFLSPPLPH